MKDVHCQLFEDTDKFQLVKQLNEYFASIDDKEGFSVKDLDVQYQPLVYKDEDGNDVVLYTAMVVKK